MNLEGKTAVVTGGTKGIGFAIAEGLSRSGANVFVCALVTKVTKTAVEDLSRHGHAEGEVCDVRSEDQVRMMLEECERVFGGVDVWSTTREWVFLERPWNRCRQTILDRLSRQIYSVFFMRVITRYR